MGRMLRIAALTIFLLCFRTVTGAAGGSGAAATVPVAWGIVAGEGESVPAAWGAGAEVYVPVAWNNLGIRDLKRPYEAGYPERSEARISEETGRRIKEAFKLSDALTSPGFLTVRHNLKSFPRIKYDITFNYHIIKATGPNRGASFAAAMDLFPSGRRSPEKNLFGLEKLRL